jgi:CDGSH-type Zn-finger protein
MSMKVTIAANGPILVSGSVPLNVETIEANEAGDSLSWRPGRAFETKEKYALCRCGQSSTKPYCDGTHARIGFDGTETASKAPYAELAEAIEGPALTLDDAESLCAFARFCDVGGSVWNLTEESGEPGARKLAIEEAERCPSGRLVARDGRKAYEPMLPPSIGLVEDPFKGCSGPVWVRGGIEVIAADGSAYPVRNRQTLCRCGASNNKPFCDGAHADTGFNDGFLGQEPIG